VSEPVVDVEDTVPEPDDVKLMEDELLPEEVEDVPEPQAESEELADAAEFEDVEELPDIPGGDFVNRRTGFVER